MDIADIFAGVTRGRHGLIPAMHALLNFAKLRGYDKVWIEALKEAIPKREIGVDLRVPSEDEIVDSLRVVEKASLMRHKVAYNLALDSGLRLTEVVRLIGDFGSVGVESLNGFYAVPVGMFRRSKVAYYGFFTEYTMRIMKQLSERDIVCLRDKNATKYVQKLPEVIAYKYVRKFAFDKMIELEIPESVADFIQGRTPKSIGAKHYMVLVRQAKRFYPRYAEYITELRQKALN
jgi:intergrase/recombinase